MGPVRHTELPVKRARTTASTTPAKSFRPKLVMRLFCEDRRLSLHYCVWPVKRLLSRDRRLMWGTKGVSAHFRKPSRSPAGRSRGPAPARLLSPVYCSHLHRCCSAPSREIFASITWCPKTCVFYTVLQTLRFLCFPVPFKHFLQ